MTLLAFLFMTVSVSTVVGFTTWCYYRVLTSNSRAKTSETELSYEQRQEEP